MKQSTSAGAHLVQLTAAALNAEALSVQLKDLARTHALWQARHREDEPAHLAPLPGSAGAPYHGDLHAAAPMRLTVERVGIEVAGAPGTDPLHFNTARLEGERHDIGQPAALQAAENVDAATVALPEGY